MHDFSNPTSGIVPSDPGQIDKPSATAAGSGFDELTEDLFCLVLQHLVRAHATADLHY